MIKNLLVVLIGGIFLVSLSWAGDKSGHVVPERPPETSKPDVSLPFDETSKGSGFEEPKAGETIIIGNTEFRIDQTETGEIFLVPTGKKIEKAETESADEKEADDEWATEEYVEEYSELDSTPKQKKKKRIPSSSKKARKNDRFSR